MITENRSATTVPLGAGAALAFAFVFPWLTLGSSAPWPVGTFGPALLTLAAYFVMARGLLGQRGILGESRLTRASLIAAGVAGILATIPGRVPLPGLPDALNSASADADFTPVVIATTTLTLLNLALLIVSAVSIQRSLQAHRSAAVGLRILSAALLLATAAQFALGAVGLDTDLLVAILSWMGKLFSLAGVAAGVAVAWPALEPPLHAATAGLRRGYRRYVDSTP